MRRVLFGAMACASLMIACSDGGTTNASSGTASGGSGGAGSGGSETGGGGGSNTGGNGSGGANTGGNGSGGGQMACTPGETASCYSGPFGTDGIGECKSGTKTCDASGNFGACEGEVVPQAESCTTSGDEDCDGLANEEGQDCVCIPGSFKLCYSGADGTAGVGICSEGVLTCNPDGLGYGPCVGEVLPGVEDCKTPIDEDCDGQTPLCPALWNVSFGSMTGNEFAWSVGVDSTGAAVYIGDMEGTVDLGGGPVTSAGLSDIFLVKRDAMGNYVWSKKFGDVALQSGQSVAVGPADEIVIVGYFQGTVNFGGGNLTTSGGADMFIAKFDAAGNHIWSKKFGSGTDDQLALAVAIDAAGDIYFTGALTGSISFGGTTLASTAGSDVFVVKLAGADGAHVWSKKFGDAGLDQSGRAIAVDGMGNVLVTGAFDGTVDFGGGARTTAGFTDVFVAKFDPAGNHLFSNSFGDAAVQLGRGIAGDATGNFVVVGDSSGTIDLGGGALAKAGGFDIFVGVFDAAGAHMKSESFGGPNNDSVTSVAHSNGAIAFTGYYDGKMTFGGKMYESVGGRDILVAKLSMTDLSVIGARSFGDVSFYQSGQSVRFDANGNAVIAGYAFGTVDFGLGPLMSTGGADAFVATIPF